MKVLFITELLDDYGVDEPLGILSLAAVLNKEGHEVKLAPAHFEKAQAICDEYKPDILAYSLTTLFAIPAIKLNRQLRQRGTYFSIFGGPHPTFFPEMIEEEGVDAICIGEGEEAIVDFIGKVETKKDYSSTLNWWVKTPEGIVKNPIRPLIQNLDALPLADRRSFYSYIPKENFKRKAFMASRGCPYNCTYCFNHKYAELYKGLGRRVRYRTVENVLMEIEDVREKYPPLELVHFSDDVLVLNNKWFSEFAIKYPKRIGIPYSCMVRIDNLNEDMVAKLKASGCHYVIFAIETGNETFRASALNRHMTNDTIIQGSKLLKGAGIKIYAQNMLGLPGGDLSKDLETLDLNIQCRPDFVWTSLFYPFPRTVLGNRSRDLGLIDDKINFAPTTYYQKSPLKIPNKKETENLHKLFALFASFPILRPLVRPLIALPLGNLYEILRRSWKGYTSFRLAPYSFGIKGFVKRTSDLLFKKGY